MRRTYVALYSVYALIVAWAVFIPAVVIWAVLRIGEYFKYF